MRTFIDNDGRRYLEEPLLEHRGPLATTNADGSLPFASGFKQGQQAGISPRGNILVAIVMYILVLALGMPVLFWSKYLWLPILGCKDRKAVSLGKLLKGLFSVVVWVPFYALFVTITLGGLAMFIAPIGTAVMACAPVKSVLLSSVAVFGVMGSFYQGMNGDLTQTPAALSAHVAYAERYTGPWLYQALGLATLMVLAISRFICKARGTGEAPNQFRFWVVTFCPALIGIMFCTAGWYILGMYLLVTGSLFLLHLVGDQR